MRKMEDVKGNIRIRPAVLFGASDPNGNLDDLQSVTQQLPDGMGGWNTVCVEYYRYWLGTESTGIAHGSL